MKNAKKYLSALLALAVAAPTFTGCDNGLDEYPSDAQIPAPSDKFTTEIQFVSRPITKPCTTISSRRSTAGTARG